MISPPKHLFTLFLSLAALNLSAQEVIFEKLYDSNRGISDIALDQNGLVWFTSMGDGLYHFNGSEFLKVGEENYSESIDSTSLSTSLLSSLEIDENNNLWLGTLGHGLEYYDVETGFVIHNRYDSLNAYSISNDTITDVLIDNSKNLWVATRNGISIKKPGKEGFENHYQSSSIYGLYEDLKGNIWITLGNKFGSTFNTKGGLIKYNVETEDFKKIVDINEGYGNFGKIFVDAEGKIYITVENRGIGVLDEAISKLTFPKPLRTDTTLALDFHSSILFQDKRNQVWIGSYAGGIKLYDPIKGSITARFGPYIDPNFNVIEEEDSEFTSFPTSYLFEPETGIFWIGSDNGLYRVSRSEILQIPFFSMPYYESNSMYIQRNILFIATSDHGLVQKNLTTGEVRLWNEYDDADVTIPGLNTIWGMQVNESTKTIWLGSTSEGLFKVTYNTSVDFPFYKPEKIKNYSHVPDDKNSIIDDQVNGLIMGKEGLIWLATASGLSSFDPQKEVFTNYQYDENDNTTLSSSLLLCVEQGSGDAIWVGGDQGISRMDKKTGNFTHYPMELIKDLCMDKSGLLWAGNRKGIYYYNPKTKVFERLTKEAIGVEIQNVIGIKEDWNNNLWVSTKNEIIRINSNRASALIFSEKHGVKFNKMGWQDNHLSYDEELFLGHHNGYYHFNPEDFDRLNLPNPILNFSRLKIGNEVINPGEDSPLSKPLNQTDQIQLSYEENTFSIEFSGVDYVFNEELDYRFKLENYNSEWNDLGNDNKVFFFQVPPGNYTLKVIASNAIGMFSEREIEIIIGKPWWLKPWAFAIYISTLSCLVLAVNTIQRRRTLRKERERVKDRQLEHAAEIEEAYKQLRETQNQLIHAEKMASLGELTAGIAHEIQNPLNFVNNFSELNQELLNELKEALDQNDQEEIEYIIKDLLVNEEKVRHHGKRAEDIVRSMLQHSRSRNSKKEFININSLAEEYLRLSFHGLRAKDKSFNADFKTTLDDTIPEIEVVPQEIGRVLLNLINNAFHAVSEKNKISENGFTPSVEVITKNKESNIEIIVKDNGPGIPDEIRDKIFQPFFTTKPTGEGTGLGLSMSYDIVTKGHRGDIKVNSDKEVGTEFVIHLPIA